MNRPNNSPTWPTHRFKKNARRRKQLAKRTQSPTRMETK